MPSNSSNKTGKMQEKQEDKRTYDVQKNSAPFRNSKTAIYFAGNFVVCFGSILVFWMKNATHVERHAPVQFYLARPYPTAGNKPFL